MSISKQTHTSMLRKAILTGSLIAVGIYFVGRKVLYGLRTGDADIPFASRMTGWPSFVRYGFPPLDIAVCAAVLTVALYLQAYLSNLDDTKFDSWYVMALSVFCGSVITAGVTVMTTMIGGWLYGLIFMIMASLLCGCLIMIVAVVCMSVPKRLATFKRHWATMRSSRRSRRLPPRNRTHRRWRLLDWLRAEDVPKEDGEYGD